MEITWYWGYYLGLTDIFTFTQVIKLTALPNFPCTASLIELTFQAEFKAKNKWVFWNILNKVLAVTSTIGVFCMKYE